MAAEAHALCRNVDGHRFFKPGNPFRMDADGYGECPPRPASPFRSLTSGSPVGRSMRPFFEMKCHCKCRRGIGDAEGMAELVHFCRAFVLRRTFCLNFLACVGGANYLKNFVAPRHAREYLRLAIGKRGV